MSWNLLLDGLTQMLELSGSSFQIKPLQSLGSEDAFGVLRNKSYGAPISLKGMVILNPSPEDLSSVGIVNTTVGLLAVVSAKSLITAGLMNPDYTLVLTTKDLLTYQDSDYDITVIQRRGIIADIPLFVAIGGVKRGP